MWKMDMGICDMGHKKSCFKLVILYLENLCWEGKDNSFFSKIKVKKTKQETDFQQTFTRKSTVQVENSTWMSHYDYMTTSDGM